MEEKKIDELIALGEKRNQLLQELKESLKYESCTHHLVEHEGISPARYSLVKIDTQEILSHGPLTRIESYVRIRGMDTNLIYNYENRHY